MMMMMMMMSVYNIITLENLDIKRSLVVFRKILTAYGSGS